MGDPTSRSIRPAAEPNPATRHALWPLPRCDSPQVNSADNLTYLAVGVNSALSNITEDELICGGVPSLQRRTSAMMPNNGCPAIFTAIDGSCTCLPDYSGLDTWEFLVTTSTSDDAIPVSLNATDVLPIDAIRTLLVPSTVNSLYVQHLCFLLQRWLGYSWFLAANRAITGVGEEPQTIAFVPQDVDLPGSALPIAVNEENINDATSITAGYSTRASNADDTQHEVNPVFLEDPVIVTNRIEYKQLKLGRCISKGGFGLVFAGEYKGHRVAVKKIRPDRSGDVAEIEVFLKEIILMAVLYHPRIVEFIGVAWDNLRHLSAVTEFMDNGDLRNVLHGLKEQGAPLTWDTHKATIALHIAEALSYLHSLKPKVIHRDLKSKNVLLNMYLEAKLSDFGISRMRYVVETHMTAGVGTSFWIAPEVLLGWDYDEAADIYSFGVVLSEIDTDDYPYWNDANPDVAHGQIQEAEILSQVAAGQLRPDFSADCPEEILDLAECCLQQNPKDRPSAAEVVAVVRGVVDAAQDPDAKPPLFETVAETQQPELVELGSMCEDEEDLSEGLLQLDHARAGASTTSVPRAQADLNQEGHGQE
ncbi:hypothetical protein BBJ28_00018777 [Nothophytophthora sp. Chile5]|nr:hypothetical protein BBJ28_00018777 [Nothophytophthora sp. Chile5]